MKTINLADVFNNDTKCIVITKKESLVIKCILKAAYSYFSKCKYEKLAEETIKYYKIIFNKKHAN